MQSSVVNQDVDVQAGWRKNSAKNFIFFRFQKKGALIVLQQLVVRDVQVATSAFHVIMKALLVRIQIVTMPRKVLTITL